jgi:hypothetical protein
MSRQSAFRGTWSPNKRPFVSFSPDCYIAFQGEIELPVCGDCQRKVNFNDYVTGISTEASVDAPPGSATINLSIPDNDVNEFYVDGQLCVIPMMEVEIYAKGYYLIGGMPQYYRIFWGLVQSVSKNWENGVTSITISCKDILRWWELTNATINPAFIEGFGSSAGGYQLFQNQFAGMNPYAIIIALARDAMGDFFLTTGSFTSYRPEKGSESPVIASYSKDIMAYWQLKFANIQSNLVMFGTSGQSYTLSGVVGSVSPNQIAKAIFEAEYVRLKQNLSTSVLYSNPKEIVAYKTEVARAGDTEFFQNTTQNKLSIAMQARDQMLYEFYCDTTGDIIFKPPFYNLNVLPNKPVSWIQDIDIINDSIVDSEAEVITHVTASGNAFGGATDWGLNDEFTTPRTGVYDYHLLRRYGWRRADLQLEWAGNPRKLFFHCLDWMDRLNSKRQSGTMTIPMRPELRMGFPVWVPKYDSFFYIQGIAHQYSPGGQATTTVTLTARRSKFIAPKNIGEIKRTGKTTRVPQSNDTTGQKVKNGQDETYEVTFPGNITSAVGMSQNETSGGTPAVIRDPKTGKLLGYPNVVMVYRSTFNGTDLARILETKGKSDSKKSGKKSQADSQKGKPVNTYDYAIKGVLQEFWSGNRDKLISRIRAHRYEAGMTNTGAYDYAHDVGRVFREFALVPATSITWGAGTDGGPDAANIPGSGPTIAVSEDTLKNAIINDKQRIKDAQKVFDAAVKKKNASDKALSDAKKNLGNNLFSGSFDQYQNTNDQYSLLYAATQTANQDVQNAANALQEAKDALDSDTAMDFTYVKSTKLLPSLNIMVRPVSDDFGFEVIGHYRYGRGAFIDRGMMQVQDDQTRQTINQLNIQFAPTAGLLTDGSVGVNVGGESVDFASKFERMQPDDYVTGASFKGSPGNNISDIQTTSAATYTNIVNANRGTGLYIEADALRRSKTLAELKPNINMGDFDKAVDSTCSCSLSRSSWLSLLPQDLIQKVVSGSIGGVPTTGTMEPPVSPSSAVSTQNPNLFPPKVNIYDTMKEQAGVSTGDVRQLITSGSLDSNEFFKQLSQYLIKLFDNTYDQFNAPREDAYTAASRNIINPFDVVLDQEQDNTLNAPGGSLFDQASLGDPDALAALQKDANFNFGLSSDALTNFKKVSSDSGARAKASLTDLQNSFGRMPGTPVVSISSGAPQQQYQPPTPTIGNSVINPTRNSSI